MGREEGQRRIGLLTVTIALAEQGQGGQLVFCVVLEF